MARAMQDYADHQPGWSERLAMHAHCAVPAQAGHTAQQHAYTCTSEWLRNELKTFSPPHLSLLVPSLSPNFQSDELALRNALTQAQLGFQVLYGTTQDERLRNAANAIALAARMHLPSNENAYFTITDVAKPIHPRMRAWSCEKCSDPECEHRLFSSLTSTA
ncbi:hypothetical protein [Diaphorobacter ruginosibacter]|uniref:hypothetical protein n=1 Tax=Diaphorobacter ruginosibacter TaxID=1715720 RepID=UPI003341F8B0